MIRLNGILPVVYLSLFYGVVRILIFPSRLRSIQIKRRFKNTPARSQKAESRLFFLDREDSSTTVVALYYEGLTVREEVVLRSTSLLHLRPGTTVVLMDTLRVYYTVVLLTVVLSSTSK